jgi:hypothetical protein
VTASNETRPEDQADFLRDAVGLFLPSLPSLARSDTKMTLTEGESFETWFFLPNYLAPSDDHGIRRGNFRTVCWCSSSLQPRTWVERLILGRPEPLDKRWWFFLVFPEFLWLVRLQIHKLILLVNWARCQKDGGTYEWNRPGYNEVRPEDRCG